jgi:RNA polymerase sigma factor (sigma-70 family)
MKSMFNLEQIVEGCRKNDRKQQKALYDRYAPLFYSMCLRYAKDKAEADDVLQEGFVKIFTKIEQYSNENSFEGWMRRIILNTAINNYRQNLKHYYHDDIADNTQVETADRINQDVDFTQEELMSVIQKLPERSKLVFNMYAIEGFKHKEIAEMLEIDVATSKSQYHRAKKSIQDKLYELSKIKICR